MSGRKFVAIFLGLGALVLAGILGLVWQAGYGLFGNHEGPGRVAEAPRSLDSLRQAERRVSRAADDVGVPRPKQILFGDLHVHTTFSPDAFMLSLPGLIGEGSHPPADACDFARHCSALDFWSITDHAEGLTPAHWQETLDSIRQCDAVAGSSEDPDLVSFVGWEWTQNGRGPDEHWGPKSVIVADLEEGKVPARPIAARPPDDAVLSPLSRGLLGFRSRHPRFHDLARFQAEQEERVACPEGVPAAALPSDCTEVAATPAELFEKLDASGARTLVIPQGSTWGYEAPPGLSWDQQLEEGEHDPERQRLFEIYSGRGDNDVARPWRGVYLDENGEPSCPEPTETYLPTCWRAGEIIEARCLAEGESQEICADRAAVARAHAASAGAFAHQTVPGATAADWLDAGQCRDCDQPAFNYRPGGSAQYLLALGNFDEDDEEPRRFRMGFIGSSGSHRAQPGTGYKELARSGTTESVLPDGGPGSRVFFPEDRSEAEPHAVEVDPRTVTGGIGAGEWERQVSFFQTGGLVAVHSEARDRGSIWEGLARREVYGTTGPRILLWFDLLNPPGSQGRSAPMGSEVVMGSNPIFQVRAVGSAVQQPGCPDETARTLGPARLRRLCGSECHHPGETRRLIHRIEVVRIRPQISADEEPESLIEDPWKTFTCTPDPAGCIVTFEDADFLGAEREAVYYVRAYEEPISAINAEGVRCTFDEDGRCVEVDLCGQGGERDNCLGDQEPRAWSSPLFLEVKSEPEQVLLPSRRR